MLKGEESSSAEALARHDIDAALIDRLRAGDEAAFVTLLERHSASMLRLASQYVSRAVAEEIVQDTWLGVLHGIRSFESRSSLKTWIFTILMNRTKTRMQREGRSIPFSALDDPTAGPAEPSVDPKRFLGSDHPHWPHHWAAPPKSWGGSPEARLLSKETQAQIHLAVDALPPSQREVITLRDIDGWEPEGVCKVLGITEGNQRVLLHRARSKVRRALETYFEET